MKILHGEDLMISVDGVALLAAKSCDIKIKVATQKKSSPTSGEWEEVVAGKKSWSVATNHLMYAGTQPTLSNTNTFYLNAFNNATEGWRVLGECKISSSQTNILDERGSVDEGIYILKIAKQTGTLVSSVYIETTAWYDLADYLTGNFSSENHIFIIATLGKYAINRATCTLLNDTYHVPLPFVELGGTINNETVYVDTPLLLMGGKGITQGMCAYGQTDNVIKATFYNGELPVANGLSGMAIKVGQMCTLRMRNTDDQTIMTGQALCTEFDISAAKNALMKGNFSWKGNGELQTSAYQPKTKDLMPYINYIMVDMTKQNPAEMISGDINGNIIQSIRKSFHRYAAVYRNSELKICQLSDEKTYLFPDGSEAKLDGTRGDVLVKHKTFYTHVDDYGGGVFRIGFAERQINDTWTEWSENDMIGAYQGSATTTADGDTEYTEGGTAGYIRSVAGMLPVTLVQPDNYETMANNMGYGFTGIKLRHHNLMGALLMAIAGTTNSQAVYGNGVMEVLPLSVENGSTNDFGMNDTNAGIIGPVNFCGLENWWGNVMEYMNNVQGGGTWYVWTNGHSGTRREVEGVDYHSGNGYIAKVALDQNLDLIPTELQAFPGNSQMGFCDYLEWRSGATSTGSLGRGGKGSSEDQMAGAFYLYAGFDGSALPILGTRLCYQGDFEELTPTEFKALWNSY